MFPTLSMKEVWTSDCSLVYSWPQVNQDGQQKEFKKEKNQTTAKPSNATY
jgi:hypothetical protein